MTKIKATITGLIISPLIPAIGVALTSPGLTNDNPITILELIPIFYFFAAMAVVVFALPAFLLLQHYRLVTWASSLAGGIITGILVALTLGNDTLNNHNPYTFQMFILPVLSGAVSGIIFWLIWSRGR